MLLLFISCNYLQSSLRQIFSDNYMVNPPIPYLYTTHLCVINSPKLHWYINLILILRIVVVVFLGISEKKHMDFY